MIIYGKQVSLYVLKSHEAIVRAIYISKRGILPKELYLRYKNRIKFIDNRYAQKMARRLEITKGF